MKKVEAPFMLVDTNMNLGIELQIQGPLNKKPFLKLIERKIGLPFQLKFEKRSFYE